MLSRKKDKRKFQEKNKFCETPEVNALRDQVEAADTIAMVRRDDEYMGLYRALKDRLKQAIEMKVRDDYIKYIKESENRSRAIWKVTYSKKRWKRNLKTDDLNTFFVSIGNNLSRGCN
ncbi:hypothetical protein HHI36_023014 [Cryptolaemus montrouzieri]|uniref:Uncharacterized protein n=1 Tax=Cryptolaemus montrouzieri TaxID=559131 RepID=A0ABD2PFP0_9CUCU